jgi:phosphopantothenoylcysteine synthetase/decarboxylase
VVLNDASALNADRTTVTVLSRDGDTRRLEGLSKADVAARLVRLLDATP